jgi:hypothetical protein
MRYHDVGCVGGVDGRGGAQQRGRHPARNLSRSLLVASPSGYPAGWPSR